MDMDVIRGLLTAALLLLFIGLGIWTWSRNRTETFEAAASMALDDSPLPAQNDTRGQDQ